MLKIRVLILSSLIGFAGCADSSRQNDKPRYASDSGLPTNCRALIKEGIDGVRAGRYSAAESLASIDRNCGEFGHLW